MFVDNMDMYDAAPRFPNVTKTKNEIYATAASPVMYRRHAQDLPGPDQAVILISRY
jgi:hypothetical protein